ncbi:DUF3592 domain-containing protein [Haloferula sp.]|uniref:DUF3592 domain-containing protein n=1 Tax=Haloferula sp. TaxID=2497595 RepID=UPI00329E10E0
MNIALVGSIATIAVGLLLLVAGAITLVWWTKRSRWERCKGRIESFSKEHHADGGDHYRSIVSGRHRKKDFRFTSAEVSFSVPEVGKEVQVSYDPSSDRYLVYSPFSIILGIVAPLVVGSILVIFGYRAFCKINEPNRTVEATPLSGLVEFLPPASGTD